MERMCTQDDMDKRDLYWLLETNEAIDVLQDMNDLGVRAPYPEGFTGTAFVR